MKFRNVTKDALEIPSLGITVEAGDEFTVTADEADGIVLQTLDGPFAAVDNPAKAAVKRAKNEDDEPAEETPAEKENG